MNKSDKNKLLKTEWSSTPFDKVSIQVDIDGMWAVKKCYNIEEGGSFYNDPVYEEAIPRFIELFKKYEFKADFFVVGRDMELTWKANLIKQIIALGHEIGNHSYHHILGMTLLDEETIKTEILASQAILKAVLGKWPQKFRAPGYDINGKIIKVLSEYNIKFDQSLFPTPWGFLMRLADNFLKVKKGRKKNQYGSILNIFAPLKPYYPSFKYSFLKGKQRQIVEIPVSVTPILRLPFHFGIILNLGEKYFLRALKNLHKRKLPIHFLFHGVDLVDISNNPVFGNSKKNKVFGPSIEKKLIIADRILSYIKKFEESDN